MKLHLVCVNLFITFGPFLYIYIIYMNEREREERERVKRGDIIFAFSLKNIY